MSDDANQRQSAKPDGSAYAQHLAGIAERNTASTKAGRERRAARERVQAADRRAMEKLQNEGMPAAGRSR